MKTILVLSVFHMLGDFYLQSDAMARKKQEHIGTFIIHAVIYAFCMSIIFLCAPLCPALISWAIISVSHIIIDKIRIIYDRNKEHEKKKLKSLLIDQLLHLCFIFGCYVGFMRFNSGFIHHQLYVLPWFTTVLVYISILSIIMKPTAVLVSCVFESCFHASVKKDESKMDLGAGRWIGVLERVIVAVLVLLNASSAIGFVLTAKSIARFKQLEESKDFAEHYLIGTLLSVGIALGAVFLIPQLCP